MNNARNSRPGTFLAFLVILACALTLRLYHLGYYDLWFDELSTDLFSFQSVREISVLTGIPAYSILMDNMKNDPHSSFYYFLVYGYSALFGGGLSLRILSVFFSMLALGLLYRLACSLFDRDTGLVALAVMAFSPFQVWYAQEARVYAVATFFATWMIYLFTQALRTGRRAYWIWFSIASILTIGCTYYGIVLFMCAGAVVLTKAYRRHFERWIQSFFAVLVFFMFFQALIIAQLQFVKEGFWLPPPTGEILMFTWRFFSLGYAATEGQYQAGLAWFLVLFACGAYAYFRQDRKRAGMLLLFLLLPVVVVYLYSKWVRPIYIHRQFIIISPFFYLFIAKGIMSFRRDWLRVVAMAGVFAFMTAALGNYYRGYMYPYPLRGNIFLGALQKAKYSELITHMAESYRKGDLIVTPDLVAYSIVHAHMLKDRDRYGYEPSRMFCFLAYPSLLEMYDAQYVGIIEPVDALEQEEWRRPHTFSFFHPDGVRMDQIRLEKDDVKRIWLVSSTWEKGVPFVPNAVAVRKLMDGAFRKVRSEARDGVYVDLYIK